MFQLNNKRQSVKTVTVKPTQVSSEQPQTDDTTATVTTPTRDTTTSPTKQITDGEPVDNHEDPESGERIFFLTDRIIF